ncbi:hypothetical protein QTP88_019711 [Uroleucon formosanum]
MICAKNLDVSLWAEAVKTAVYTLNLTGISSQKGKPPYELYYKVVPDIKHLRVFGTFVYTHIPKQKRQKWDPKSEKGIFVGYSNSTKGYRVCMVFENECQKFENIITDKLELTETQINSTGVQAKDEQTVVDDRNVIILRDQSTLKKPDRYNIHTFIGKCVNQLNYDEAMTGPNKNEWEHAMYDEITSLYESIRAILAVTAVEKLILRQFDIKIAFLYGDLQEEIYMVQPMGFEHGSNKVCKLQRSLYGLKQAPRRWNLRSKNFLNIFGLQCTEADAYNEDVIEELLTNLEKEFEVKKGNLEYFLAKELSIPIDKLHTIEQKEDSEILSEEIPYRQAVGSLLFLSLATGKKNLQPYIFVLIAKPKLVGPNSRGPNHIVISTLNF